jgi:uncharacterized membrane protein YukC
MDEVRVLARLDRIEELKHELKHSGAAPAELLVQLQAELRGLLREAEALTREQDDAKRGTEEVVGRLRTALARDIIGM